MTPELLSEEESADLYGVSVRKFAELRDEKWMPLPVVLGPRFFRWSRAELLENAVQAAKLCGVYTARGLDGARTRHHRRDRPVNIGFFGISWCTLAAGRDTAARIMNFLHTAP